MVSLADLWLPILLSAVFVFIASSVIHMAIPMHKGDWVKLPGEDKVLEALRAQNVPPGSYMFPMAASMKDCSSPEMVAKMKTGPVGNMTVIPSGPMSLGKPLAQWFVFCVVVGLLVAYVGRLGLEVGADRTHVFRLTSAAAFLGYGLTNVTDSIWKGVRWGITGKFLIDGLIYGLLTGVTFRWLWPALG